MIKVADWVTINGFSQVGTVTKVAKDGSWANVRWSSGGKAKRMQTNKLTPHATIETQNWTITDMDREKELQQEA